MLISEMPARAGSLGGQVNSTGLSLHWQRGAVAQCLHCRVALGSYLLIAPQGTARLDKKNTPPGSLCLSHSPSILPVHSCSVGTRGDLLPGHLSGDN